MPIPNTAAGVIRSAHDCAEGGVAVALSRDGKRQPLPTAVTRLEAGDMIALTGSGNAIGLAAALLRARDTSSPRSATAATAPPAG